ncbi:MAG: hypothetical protein SWO11_04815 [Thermodesulfobacteriota bacterium]|nr:hypothetical protein [Thermodesulfobacteriota bacterium]
MRNLKIKPIVFLIIMLFIPDICNAKMVPLRDIELCEVAGNDGVHLVFSDLKVGSISPRYIEDGYVEFGNITIDNGSGGVISEIGTLSDPFMLDVGTKSGWSFIDLEFPDNSASIDPLYISIENMISNGIYFGSSMGTSDTDTDIWIKNIVFHYLDSGLSHIYLGPHYSGNVGLSAEVALQAKIEEFLYAYNPYTTNPDSYLKISNIHLFDGFLTPYNNNPDPASWPTQTGTFNIGVFSDDLVTVDVSGGASPLLVLSLPIQGSIRLEQIEMNYNNGADFDNFGPLLIDQLDATGTTYDDPSIQRFIKVELPVAPTGGWRNHVNTTIY